MGLNYILLKKRYSTINNSVVTCGSMPDEKTGATFLILDIKLTLNLQPNKYQSRYAKLYKLQHTQVRILAYSSLPYFFRGKCMPRFSSRIAVDTSLPIEFD